jgi:osmotically-inducible protein OsmY
MKLSNLSWIALPLMLATGCVYSHRDYAYTTPATTVVTPTSPRAAVRVYPDSTTARVGTRPGEIDDLSIANSVRTILVRDTAHIYGNVDVSVKRGVATLRGTVPTEHDGQVLRDEIAAMPGVDYVDNQLAVDLR